MELNEDEDNEKGYESDDEDEVYGVEGMTIQLIELLITLVSKPSVQELVKMGMAPLMMTISSYMILTNGQEKQFLNDPNTFISDDEDEASLRSLRNSCLDFQSQLIDNFDDCAIEALLFAAEKLLMAPETKAEVSSLTSLPDFNEINVLEFTYNSPNPKHVWKKREVGLLILGSITEDINAYR
jgi:hypothetical protein